MSLFNEYGSGVQATYTVSMQTSYDCLSMAVFHQIQTTCSLETTWIEENKV